MTNRGVWTILNAPRVLIRGTPGGMQRARGSSLCSLSWRCCESALAQGWKGASAGLRSIARSIKCDLYSPYKLSCSWASQIPERSGLPSGVLGAGADRLGLPSAVRGVPGAGKFNHWAEAAVEDKRTAHTALASND